MEKARAINPEGKRVFQQNVRVGDRLGIRLSGEGATLDLRPDKRMSETAYFSEIYIRGGDGGELIRIRPDLSMSHLIRLGKGNSAKWTTAPIENLQFHDYYAVGIARLENKTGTDNFQGEIVIIPTIAYQTPETLSTLPQSTIAEEFNQIEATLNPTL